MKKILIFSSFAEDYIVYKDETLQWWPAYFFENNLKKLKANFSVLSGKNPWKVEIQKDKNGEDIWKILSVSEIDFPTNISFTDTIVLTSTLEKEFSLSHLQNIKNATIVLDIQWYLRNIWKEWKTVFQDQNYKYIDYLKTTEVEYQFIWEKIKKYLEHTKNKWIIITKWASEIELKSESKTHIFSVEKGDFTDTIWAGDTFLSSVCFGLSQELDIEKSIHFAVQNTYTFLQNKNI